MHDRTGHHAPFRTREFHSHRFSGGGGRERRGKLFDSTEFQLLVLKLIAGQARHGYDLMRDIEARTAGNYTPSPGVIYPTLTLLAEMGLIAEADTPGTRKIFTITREGTEKLTEQDTAVRRVFERLDAVGASGGKADNTPVRRAMGNLKAVIMTRMAKTDTSDEHVLEAARIIDQAASEIERLK